MNRKDKILDQIKMYSVLVGQQEEILTTIAYLRKYNPRKSFDIQESEVKRMIVENTARIKKFQEELEKLGG